MMNKVLFAIMLVLGLIAPFLAYPVFVMDLLCFALFACAFNLLLGYTGLLSFGHAAFFGSAAYVTGHVVKVWGFPPLMGILAGTGFALVLGAAFGYLAIRRQGIYFAMVTLALAQIIYFLALQLPFTGGENGLQGIPRGELFGLINLNNDIAMYYLVLAIFLGGFGIIYRTIHSPFGEVLGAIRENEARALSLGYDVGRFKLQAFVISASIAGLAGATKAMVFQFASLTAVHWQTSGEVVLMTLVGGLGTIFGPVVGAITVASLTHELGSFGSWVQVILGTIFVTVVLVFRRGIIGEIQHRIEHRQAVQSGATAERREPLRSPDSAGN